MASGCAVFFEELTERVTELLTELLTERVTERVLVYDRVCGSVSAS